MKYLNTFKNVSLMFLVLFASASRAQNLDTLFTANWITSIELVNKNPGEILISGPGVQRSTDYGETWNSALFDTSALFDSYDLSMNQINTNEGYHATTIGLFKTLDSGFTWFKLPVEGYFYFVNVSPLDGKIVMAQESIDPLLGEWRLFISTDGGSAWYIQSISYGGFLFNLQYHPAIPGKVYGRGGRDFYQSIDTGKTWTSILHVQEQTCTFAVKKTIPGTIYASARGLIYKTTDDGQNWIEIGAGLRAVLGNSYWIHNFVFDETTQGRFYVGLGSGLFLTENDGETWRKIHDREIYQVVGNNENPMHLYFITNAERTLIRMLDTFTVTGVNNPVNIEPRNYALEQNYPNPFNPSTTIRYQIPKDGLVTLKVYDVLGREVKTLVNSYQSAGEHFVKFDGRGLASGVYFYSLTAGDFSQTKKMILLP